MSSAARRLFFRPNWIEVKIKLKNKFKINGRIIINGICFWKTKRKTLPKDMKIKTYRKVHTGAKSHEGGDHLGFFSCEYQL
jgi:hypothetical protein